ncbi:PH domain-containing protein [Microlunatus speluncae]|uniref:PH domain-containing protein n=1 Tax=Microlunatus speluncae TaxID=2594267 RepID=UPI00126677F3|nr:PH domain-containing protein [Microlunatus speluncae]
METTDRVVLRPFWLRIIGWALAAAFVIFVVVGWFAFPASIRALVTPFQLGTLITILAALIVMIILATICSVTADGEGLRIRNGVRVHNVGWDRVHKIILRRGDPWAMALLRPVDGSPFDDDLDAERVQLMGVQGHDGDRARQAVTELRRLQAVHQNVS